MPRLLSPNRRYPKRRPSLLAWRFSGVNAEPSYVWPRCRWRVPRRPARASDSGQTLWACFKAAGDADASAAAGRDRRAGRNAGGASHAASAAVGTKMALVTASGGFHHRACGHSLRLPAACPFELRLYVSRGAAGPLFRGSAVLGISCFGNAPDDRSVHQGDGQKPRVSRGHLHRGRLCNCARAITYPARPAAA